MALNYVAPTDQYRNKFEKLIDKISYRKLRRTLIQIAAILGSFIAGMSFSTINLPLAAHIRGKNFNIPMEVMQNARDLFTASAYLMNPVIKLYLIFSLLVVVIKYFYSKEKDIMALLKNFILVSGSYLVIKNLSYLMFVVLKIFN